MSATIASLLEALDNATDHSIESLERILAEIAEINRQRGFLAWE